MTVGSLCIANWSQVDALDRVADTLAGSLEYSWSSSSARPLGLQQNQFSEVPSSGQVRFESLEAAFDAQATNSRLGVLSAKEPPSFPEASEEMYNCMVHVDSAIDASLDLLDELTKTISSSPNLAQVLSPLSKVIVMPSQDDSHQAIAAAMRSLEMGLTGFRHIVQLIPEQATQPHLASVISQAELLRQRAGDVVDCEDSASFFDLASPVSRPSCQAVQVFYDDYLDQAKPKIEARMATSSASKPLLESTLASLQFQTAGAYLTHQGAQEAVKQLEESDSSDDMRSLVESTKLVIGAGDALQACQASVQKSAIQQETSSTSVSGFEQLIYSHLGMSTKLKDPTMRVDSLEAAAISSDDIYAGCQNLLAEAIKAAKSTGDYIEVLKSETGSKIVSSILSRFVEMMEEHLERSLEERPEIELRQLEMALTILVRTIKVLPSWGTYGLMKKSLNPLQQLEGGVHRLYSCVLTKTPSRLPPKPDNPEDSDDIEDQAQASQDALRCDFLAESYKDSLSQSLKQLASVSRETVEDKDTVAFLQESIQDLAETADAWDEIGDTAVESVAEDSKQTIFRAISVRSQTVQSKATRELSELMPFMIAQANSLEACSSVWQATHGVRGAAYDDEDVEDDNEDEDAEEENAD
ncbi:hypothetical protein BGX26_010665 [Mortierella sp. AD094]|nr:hypothetical protein BGX26_010665 [Mortierella sp. AD094]